MSYGWRQKHQVLSCQISAKKKKEIIHLLKDTDANWIEDVGTIKEMFKDNYHSLYTTDVDTASWIQTKYGFPSMDSNNANHLNEELQAEEIK